MTTQPWKRVFRVFEQALERPSEERAAFLDHVCGDDEALRRGVEALFEADQQGQTSVLDRGVFESPEARTQDTHAPTVFTDAPADHGPPPAIDSAGPYRILRQIGQGGMSTVYLAVRDDDVYRRRVVVKVVRADLETASMLRRLRVERQILANLEHPHIARLYDGGNTEDGMPYFVMELIEGEPITAYCERERLSIDDRLTLFRKVCAAVHHAHQNLVVHRDIKPSNILVTTDGEPKLLDFGIAKLLEPDLIPEAEVTATWQRMLTPSYASPEQIRGEPVSTASDVYSLGVLLYELLTDSRPYDFKGRSVYDIQRLLSETEPARPSHIREMRAGLGGDVDAIVSKAMRLAPEQRYASAERLAADLERCQQGLPVAARAGGWRYRTAKFVRRNRRAVAGLATAAALIIGFVAALIVQAERVAFERDQARLESAKKSRVVSLILDIFELANPYVMPRSEMTVRQALEHSLPILTKGLQEQPDVRAELLHTSGSIFTVLGAWEQAETRLGEALDIRRDLYGDDDPRVAQSLSAMAGVRKVLDNDLEEAERLARQAVEVLRVELGPDHPDLTEPLIELVSVLCYREKYQNAEPLAAEALEIARQLPAEDDRKITALEFLAHIHSTRGDYPQAVALNRQALAFKRQLHGEQYPGQIDILSNLGVQLRRMGEYESAQRAYEEALALHQETYGDSYPDLILINNYAGVRYAQGDYSGAESSYRRALDVVLDRYGPDHWRVYSLGLRIARTLTHQGAADEAERQIRGLQQRRLVADDHLLHDVARSVLGESLSAQGRCDEAESLLIDSFETIVAKSGNVRVRTDSLDRIRDHLRRCDRPQDVSRYEAMLTADA